MNAIKFRAWNWTKKQVRNKGKGWYKQDGYIMQKAPYHPYANKRGYVAEHRLIMENHLGKFLNSCERIHHRDQDRANNELSNLELFGHQSKHSHKHLKGKRNSHGQFVCKEPIFSELKYRLYNTDTKTTYIYTLATLIGTTFRRGKFEFGGRWTGLKDKKGKEIYEGDIVKHEGIFRDIGIMKFMSGGWNLTGQDKKHDGQDGAWTNPFALDDYQMEVIGNIYENRELLK